MKPFVELMAIFVCDSGLLLPLSASSFVLAQIPLMGMRGS